jgi:hypothetical protein
MTPGKGMTRTNLQVTLKSQRFFAVAKRDAGHETPWPTSQWMLRFAPVVVCQALLQVVRKPNVSFRRVSFTFEKIAVVHNRQVVRPTSLKLRRVYFAKVFKLPAGCAGMACHTKLAGQRRASEVWRGGGDSNTRPAV